MRKCATIVWLLLAGWVISAAGGEQLSIRLVEASNRGAGSPPALNDVRGILKDSLGLDSCAFLASAWVQLPADRQTRSLGQYSVTCSGPQHSLTIVVQRGRQRLLKTTVSLKDNTPLILGGFPAQNGKHVLVFVVH